MRGSLRAASSEYTYVNRAAAAAADLDSVDRSNRRHLGGRPDEESLVGDGDCLAGQHSFDNGEAQVARQRHDGIARDAGKNRRGERRRLDGSVADDEDVLAAPFAHVAAHVERQSFRVSVQNRLHLRERGVGVIGGALRKGGQRVGRHPRPRADLDVHALLERVLTEIAPPGPQDDGGVHWILERIDAERLVAPIDDRADVTRLQLICPNRFQYRVLPPREVERVLHAIDLLGVQKAPHVGVEP